MCDITKNIYASCIKLKNKGVLFIGDSGSGKSDISLRLICEHNALLIADDRTDITIKKSNIIASSPKTLKGLLEVRGVGIIKIKHYNKVKIDLIVLLTKDKLERIPEKTYYDLCGIKIRSITINPFENSAPAKVLAALSLL